MKTPGRYLSAFVKALRMTARGERIPTPDEQLGARFPRLAAWLSETTRLVEAARSAAQAQGIHMADFVLHIEKRDVSMDTILRTVQYHAGAEYRYLLLNENEHARLALKATNVNDAFLVRRLADSPSLPPGVQPTLEALYQHLANIPAEKD
jgi:hypothetical protein